MTRRLKQFALAVFYALMFVFLFFPFFWGLRTSFADSLDYGFIPSHWTLLHYKTLISRPEFFLYLQNSLLVSGVTILVTLFAALLGGYALARLQFRGRRLGMLLLVLPLLPPVAILVPLIRYFQDLGLYNTHAAVIIANVAFNLPLAVWMLRNFIAGQPAEIEESARIDGCSRAGVLLRIVLPTLGPGLVAVAVFVFINTWNNYLYAFALTSSQSLRVLPQGVLSFLGAWGVYWGGLTAAGILVLLPPVLLFLFFQKWFVAGVFGTELK